MLTKQDKTEVEEIVTDVIQDVLFPVFKNLTEKMATKNDLKKLASKEDLKNFATKDKTKNMTTKDDLKDLAKREDLNNLASKQDFKELKSLLKENFEVQKQLVKTVSKLEERTDRLEATQTV